MTVHVPGQDGTAQQGASVAGTSRAGRLLPGWSKVLVIVAHPDDESFGLGAIVSLMTATGAAAHILCYTRGEASTLNENDTDLDREREAELQQASTELAAATVTLLDYPDGGLAAIPAPELAAHAVGLAARHQPDGVLVSTTPASPVIQITRRLPALPCRRHLSRPAGACLGPPRGDR